MDNNICARCGHVAQEGDFLVKLVDPESEWWIEMFNGPFYCTTCLGGKKEEGKACTTAPSVVSP